jgi:hypothetical protein
VPRDPLEQAFLADRAAAGLGLGKQYAAAPGGNGLGGFPGARRKDPCHGHRAARSVDGEQVP